MNWQLKERRNVTCCRDSGTKDRNIEKVEREDHAKCATQTAGKKQATLEWKRGWQMKLSRRGKRGYSRRGTDCQLKRRGKEDYSR